MEESRIKICTQEELAHDLLKVDEDDGEQKGIASLRRNLEFRQQHLPQEVDTTLGNRMNRTYQHAMDVFENGSVATIPVKGWNIVDESQRELRASADKFCYKRETDGELVRSGMYFTRGQQLGLNGIPLPEDIRTAMEEIGCISLLRREDGEWEPLLSCDF